MGERSILIGCVADDFTGAGDVASFLAAGGLRTVLTNGIPAEMPEVSGVQALVIALKSRSQEPSLAVRDSLQAMDWLREHGAQRLYFKYCSTFDSTPRGNIGPVTDAVLERYGFPYTILCPSLLVNRRAVRDGILYVNGVPLAESPMKDHPLNPMWASDLCELMKPQGKYPCFKLSAELYAHPDRVSSLVKSYQAQYPHFYLAVDYYEEAHGPQLARLFGDLPFLTGGSGLPEELARYLCPCPSAPLAVGSQSNAMPRLILAGSCSVATRQQVKNWLDGGGKGILVSPAKLASGEQSVESLWQQMQAYWPAQDLLVCSVGSAGMPEPAGEGEAARLEQTMAQLACRAVDAGCRRLICAGGETSGAITQALGYAAFYIGKSVAPGVPVMQPADCPELQLVLKSGNFGGPDFFETALQEGC